MMRMKERPEEVWNDIFRNLHEYPALDCFLGQSYVTGRCLTIKQSNLLRETNLVTIILLEIFLARLPYLAATSLKKKGIDIGESSVSRVDLSETEEVLL